MKQPLKIQSMGYMAITEEDKNKYALEKFQAEVNDKQIKFPAELGAEHPFEFEDAEKLYMNYGLVAGACNKTVDEIVGEFSVKCKNPNALQIIKDFIRNSALSVKLREWILEGVMKGNGFFEIDLKEQDVQVINANGMYVVRDKFGNVKGYNQYVGDLNRFSMTSRKFKSFLPEQIAHLPINKISGQPYGLGILKPNERTIEFMMQNELDMHKLISRKAGAPIHVQVGREGEVTDTGAVDNIKTNLQYMNNRTEWVTDANVKMNVLNFGDVGKNLSDTINHDLEMFAAGTEIPVVHFGSGQLNEGIAVEQGKSRKRKIAALQELIETIIETKIFRPILGEKFANEQIEFVWNLPDEETINARLTQLNTIIQNPFISDEMRMNIQVEMARLLNFENPEKIAQAPNTQGMTADKQMAQEEKKKEEKPTERKQEENIPQPEVPGVKSLVTQSHSGVSVAQEPHKLQDGKFESSQCDQAHKHVEENYDNMTIKEFVNLVEVKGFNYTDYLINILRRVKIDKFDELKAITEKDIENGLLTEEQTDKLRQILKDAFRKNKTMSEIERDIRNNLNLKDRIAEDGKVITAETRPALISRTETIRIANLGLIDTYKQNSVKKVRWLAALSDRTCEQCESLNGQVFEIDNTILPTRDTHPMCRCSLLSVTE